MGSLEVSRAQFFSSAITFGWPFRTRLALVIEKTVAPFPRPNMFIEAPTRESRIPVTVLTGYLGAGKTTLVNRILAGSDGRRWGVIVNEFGEAGIDGELIVSSDEELVELANGCICCTVRGDLVRTVRSLLTRPEPPQALLVETTGLAAPAPVAQTFLVDHVLLQRTRLDSITTVVDAKHILARLDDTREAVEQVAFADQIVLNKTELVTREAADAIERRLRRLNPLAAIVRAVRADVPIGDLLRRGGFDLDRITALEPSILTSPCDAPGHVHEAHCRHAHDGASGDDDHAGSTASHLAGSDIQSVSLRSSRPMSYDKVSAWIAHLVETQGKDILRLKGILDVNGDDRRLVVQAVHMQMEGDFQRRWREHEQRHSRLVLIGRGLDGAALQRSLEACTA